MHIHIKIKITHLYHISHLVYFFERLQSFFARIHLYQTLAQSLIPHHYSSWWFGAQQLHTYKTITCINEFMYIYIYIYIYTSYTQAYKYISHAPPPLSFWLSEPSNTRTEVRTLGHFTLVRILPGYQDTSGVHSYARTDLVTWHLTSDLVSFKVQVGHSRIK